MKGTARQLELIAALLIEETTLSLATSSEGGEASVAPLFYIADEELWLYWLSSESSLHSLNIERTPRAAATIYRSARSWREICGVQLRGVVSKVTEPERRAALVKAYCERFKLGRVFRLALHTSVLYCLRPEFFRYIDNARGFGYKFELTRRPEGWSITRPVA
ncbi:MAG: pyridoxamine 5'-phosphate oxidase family protein [Terracidiphilus sp.]